MLGKDLFAGVVTSLSFYNKSIVVVGHGPFLKLYNIDSGKLLACKEVLPNNRIHRITFVPGLVTDSEGVETRKLAVYGSKSISFIEASVGVDTARITITDSMGPFCDWIMDIKFLQTDTESANYDQLAIAYAHNFVEVYNLTAPLPTNSKTTTNTIQLTLFYRIQCDVRCILYSARFYGKTMADLMLASGTVFNEVHLWKINERNDQGDGVVFRQLVGHEGVIFGVRFSPDGSMLASVSDDRTIRVWSMVNPKQAPLVVFGHTARVWDCQFVDAYLVSISEDATCRVWKNSLMMMDRDAEGVNMGDSSMDCLACWEGHAGKNIWSCAVSPDHKVVATGGQDSGIRLWSLASIKENIIDSDDDLNCLLLTDEYKDAKIRDFALMDSKTVMASTAQGQLIKFVESKDTPIVSEAYQDDDLRGYSVIEGSACGRLIIAGCTNGSLIFNSGRGEFPSSKLNIHTKSINTIIIIASQVNGSLFYVLSYSFNGELYLHRLDISHKSKPSISTAYMLKLPETPTTVISASLVEHKQIMILGSKQSSVVIYRLPGLLDCHQEKLSILPDIHLQKAHSKQGFARITIKPPPSSMDDNSTANVITFWTTGRDGCYNEYRLTLKHSSPLSSDTCGLVLDSQGDDVATESKDLKLEKVYRNKVTKGWLEGAVYVDDELLLLGFYQKSFFVYNETKHYEMLSISCGGAHRRWHFNTLDARLKNASFAFIRKDAIYTYHRDGAGTTDNFQVSTLQENYHGREVRAIKYLDQLPTQHGTNYPILFATGSEDTNLRIHQHIPGAQSSFITHAIIRKHNSVVKCLEWSRGIDTLLFTGGGKEELICWKLEVHESNEKSGNGTVNCIEWATCPVVGDERIETRIMDLTTRTIDASLGLHLIGAVYSDAMIRIWLFNEKRRKFSLLVDGTFHAKCILQITNVAYQQDDGKDRILFFTSATDGRVAMWDISADLYSTLENITDIEMDPTKPAIKLTQPLTSHQLHMSGVNALEVTDYDKSSLLVVTGGEDNAVAAMLVSKTGGEIVGGQPLILPGAHASSVNGVHIFQNKQQNLMVATVSTDQRLNVWSVSKVTPVPEHTNQSTVKLELTDSIFVDIPDPSALDGLQLGETTHLTLTGIGLQSIQLQ